VHARRVGARRIDSAAARIGHLGLSACTFRFPYSTIPCGEYYAMLVCVAQRWAARNTQALAQMPRHVNRSIAAALR
jgi:hypothetical protein